MEELSYVDFLLAVQTIAKKSKDLNVDSIYGIPRGGLSIALYLSHLTGLPIIEKENINRHTLVVDDISDSGTTLAKYKLLGCKIATIYYHRQSKVKPDIWIYEKGKDWIKFPWETNVSTKNY